MIKRIKNVLAGVSALCMTVASLTSITSNAYNEEYDSYLSDKDIVASGELLGITVDDFSLLLPGTNTYDYTDRYIAYFDNDYKRLSFGILNALNCKSLSFDYVGIVDDYNEDIPFKDFILNKAPELSNTEKLINTKLPDGAVMCNGYLFVLRDTLDDIVFSMYYGTTSDTYTTNFGMDGDTHNTFYNSDGELYTDVKDALNDCLASGNYETYWYNYSNVAPYFDTYGVNTLFESVDTTLVNSELIYKDDAYSFVNANVNNTIVDDCKLLITDEIDKITGDTYKTIGIQTSTSLGTLLKQSEFYSQNITRYAYLYTHDDSTVDIFIPDDSTIERMKTYAEPGSYSKLSDFTVQFIDISNTSYPSFDSSAINLTFDVTTNDTSIMYVNAAKPCFDYKEPNQIIKPTVEEAIENVKGDATEDGRVDIIDVITVNKAILGKEVLTEQAIKNIDINKDDKPDSTDSLAIMKYIVGLIDEL